MYRILIVDDESTALESVKRKLQPIPDDWNITWATSGDEALSILRSRAFDVIVSDMAMPGMDGAELLGLVRRRFPDVARIVMSDQPERTIALRLIGTTHTYLPKPCDAAAIRTAITRCCALRDLICAPELRELASGLESVPSLPYLYIEIMQAIREDRASLSAIAQIVSRDMGMSAAVLRVANSAWLGAPRAVNNLADAVSLLGIDNLRAMVLTTHMFSQVPEERLRRLALEGLWEFCAWTAAYANRIALAERMPARDVDNATMAGFLHGVGTLLLALNIPDRYRAIQAESRVRNIPIWKLETDTLGASHADVGAYLLSLWRVPPGIVNAVAWSHRPSRYPCDTLSAVVVVHAAHAFACGTQISSGAPPDGEIDMELMDRLRLGKKVETWRRLCDSGAGAALHAA